MNDLLGVSVAVSADAAMVGEYADDTVAGTDAGSAYVFVRSGTTWTQQARLTPPDGAADEWFGHSVALGSTTAVVGVDRDDLPTGSDVGSAYVIWR